MLRITGISILLVGLAAGISAQDVMTPEKLWQLERVLGGVLSPDGQHAAYVVQTSILADDASRGDIWVVRTNGSAAPEKLTDDAGIEGDLQWIQTTAGPRLFFVTKRAKDTAPQAYAADVEKKTFVRVTDVDGGIANLKVAPNGKKIAYTIDVKLDQTVNDLFKDLPKANARIIDDLMYRHWNQWHDFAYSHLCVADLSDDLTAGPGRDLMEGLKTDCPLGPFGGNEQIAWSPDGGEIAFVMKIVGNPAESTNSDLYVHADGKLKNLSVGNPGYDMDPVYSPDGRYLSFLSMARNGYEADRNRLMLYDRREQTMVEVSAEWDQNAHNQFFAPDSKSIYFRSEHRGTDQIFRTSIEKREPVQVTSGKFNYALLGVSQNGEMLLMSRQSMIVPAELCTIKSTGGDVTMLTKTNDERLTKLALPEAVERWTPATDGEMIHSWIVYPPNFDKKKKYPMLTYCQGGPQSQVSQFFSWRWNFHLMAAQGYIVLGINRRGLPGFGTAWNEAISGDWGGQCMRDLLAVTDDMLTEPYVDQKRVGAVGASFGGYSVYWLMGHSEDRFACMISHCGVFNFESMYGTTEELFFVNWDLGGPYWQDRGPYEAFSPNRYVGNWKTPLLVIHNEKDFRVPIGQGMEAFTAAKLQGVPARFLYFPEEGHWVNRPQNSVLWQRVFFDWLNRWLKREN